MAAAAASVEHLKQSSYERDLQKERVRYLRSKLVKHGIPYMDIAQRSHIVPVMVGDPVKCKELTDRLLHKHGIYIQPINYPTVPKGEERIRITPGPLHSEECLDYLFDCLFQEWQDLELPRIPSEYDAEQQSLETDEPLSMFSHYRVGGSRVNLNLDFGAISGHTDMPYGDVDASTLAPHSSAGFMTPSGMSARSGADSPRSPRTPSRRAGASA